MIPRNLVAREFEASVEVSQALYKRHWTIAAAESLTAGEFCARLADVPGASSVLRGGVVVYATELKHVLAGVRNETLLRDGPVAATTAFELALGVRDRCNSTLGVGLTGVAGPDPQDGHVPGTVFIGIVGPDTDYSSDCSLPGEQGIYPDLSHYDDLDSQSLIVDGSPVGSLVEGKSFRVARLHLAGGRNQIRAVTVEVALSLVRDLCQSSAEDQCTSEL